MATCDATSSDATCVGAVGGGEAWAARPLRNGRTLDMRRVVPGAVGPTPSYMRSAQGPRSGSGLSERSFWSINCSEEGSQRKEDPH